MSNLILPETDDVDSAPFWAATREQRLVVQKCDGCGRLRFPPHPYCPHCRSIKMSWPQVSGKGKIWSFIVMHKPTLAAFEPYAPFPVIVVALDDDERLRMTGNLVAAPGAAINSVDPKNIKIGAPVKVTFAKMADDVTLPYWTLV